ncbi:hypothetical protein ATANTOWER_030149 [Ataeniobius toweri]|uniref:Uncharacterized protein n=1 Tax=Ataeniobius toweri TaxID=208326 RepID=A0ABU7BLQ3_9TELE|nr:hypothetical protein [Ataeniobius toweri]
MLLCSGLSHKSYGDFCADCFGETNKTHYVSSVKVCSVNAVNQMIQKAFWITKTNQFIKNLPRVEVEGRPLYLRSRDPEPHIFSGCPVNVGLFTSPVVGVDFSVPAC